ncbi:MAG: hypothetical protein HY248_04470 [Fimbriimonas ginsengisoli]|uniref:Cytochrome c-552/4 domain-containing protein n=1 Tax=Fimbriimonas ginsengisoli TaxID=1005039 RepID=A0A931PV86_FIMGI|nr:hypothetical protein [Fimbriimonas ginsengisoli]MBI3721788.1 hypothetical protein [Fimbriimonas ginsengisoli]
MRREGGARPLVLYSGDMVTGTGRQDLYKAQALAEALGSLESAVVQIGAAELSFGQGAVDSIADLSGRQLVESAAVAGSTQAREERPPFLVAAAEGVRVPDQARSAVESAKAASLAPIVLLLGDRAAASALARQFPELALIVFSQSGTAETLREGPVLIVSPGSKLKSVVRLRWTGDRFETPAVIDLGPEWPDDPAVARIFARYLRRVAGAGLIDQIPRVPSGAFAGSTTCGACHGAATAKWKRSAHARALATLEHEHEAADPDCVRCHTTGLGLSGGFYSRARTPALAAVGCESCHGPARDHARSPHRARLPKVGLQACQNCHTLEQSPGFDAAMHWQVIRHR